MLTPSGCIELAFIDGRTGLDCAKLIGREVNIWRPCCGGIGARNSLLCKERPKEAGDACAESFGLDVMAFELVLACVELVEVDGLLDDTVSDFWAAVVETSLSALFPVTGDDLDTGPSFCGALKEPFGRPGRLPWGLSRMLLLLRHWPVLGSNIFSRPAAIFLLSLVLRFRSESRFSASRLHASLRVRGKLDLRPALDAGVVASKLDDVIDSSQGVETVEGEAVSTSDSSILARLPLHASTVSRRRFAAAAVALRS